MDDARHMTYIPNHFKWVYFALGMVTVLVAKHLTENSGSRGMTLLIWTGALLLCVGLMRLVDFLLIEGEFILTPEGVEKKTRTRTTFTPWRKIIQAGAVKEDGVRMVVLLKSGGHKLPENGNWEWFRMRNSGKLLCLPDEEHVHHFVTAYYGGLDYDLRNKKKEIADP